MGEEDQRSRVLEGRDPEDITVAPDGRPMGEQPQWRQDFPIDWTRDQYVARRDFTKFVVLTSGGFVAGQGWIAAQELIRARRPGPAPMKIANLSELAVGSSRMFNYPGERDPCLLVHIKPGEVVAYSQKCTHLSCAVVPRVDEGILYCPCHEGYFELATGRNMAGPPPRPLPRIELELRGDAIYAVGVVERSV